MSTVLGLDLSLRRSGLALWRDGDMSTDHVGYGEADPKSYIERGTRIARVADEIRTRIAPLRDQLDLVVLEQYTLVRGGPTDVDITQLHGFVVNAVISWRIPFAYVHNGTLKAFATGKGRADKADMQAAAIACGWRPANHDEADACWLAGMGGLYLGDQMPFPGAEWRSAGLTKVAWPVRHPRDVSVTK